MSKVYDFNEQLALGKIGEAVLDTYFAQWYAIEPFDLAIEKAIGADRLFISPRGHQTLVEYKTDFMAHETGNVIVEMVSADSIGSTGWGVKSQAEILIVFVYYENRVLIIRMSDLRANLDRWNATYRKIHIRNKRYDTIGIIVPLHEYEEIAIQQFWDIGKEIGSE